MGAAVGEQPTDLDGRKRWIAVVSTVAAYRDRYNVTGDLAVGGGAATDAQRTDRHRALDAVRSDSAVGREPGQAVPVAQVPSITVL